MFESYTYEYILKQMLKRAPSDADKREGSIIYDALAPAAAELSQMYINLDSVLLETFIQTATGTYLDERVAEYGISRHEATNAVVKAQFNVDIPIGSRFSGGSLNYFATEKVSEGVFLLQCEQKGTDGNHYLGTLTVIDYIKDLTTAAITEISIPAVDEETDDELKKRFFASITGGAQDGNVSQYKKWANEFYGIGNVKVFPLWNGVNTVKVSILDAENNLASDTLIGKFQEYLDPCSKGLGNGKAPIGAVITVSTATEKILNISAEVYLENGYSEAKGVKDDIEKMFSDISYINSVVNFYEVASKILNNKSVARIKNLKINSAMDDIILADEEIPKLGDFSLEVVTE